MLDKKMTKTKVGIWLSATVLIVAFIMLLSVMRKTYLKVIVDPSSARVTVNNFVISLDESGTGSTTLSPGEVEIKVEDNGYIGYSQKVKLRGGRTNAFQFVLQKNPSPVVIGDSEEANKNVQFISEADEDDSIFYLANNGSTLYKAKFSIESDGNIKTIMNRPISNPPLSGIKNIIWSPNKDAAIFYKGSGAYTFFDFKKYNFVSQEEIKYGENIGDLAWSPDNSKIAYYYAPPSGEKSLIFANHTNTEITRVANFVEMGIENPYLSWSPNSEWLIVIPRNSDLGQNKIYLFNAYTRSFTTVLDEGSNIEAVFSRDGEKIIYAKNSVESNNPVRQMLYTMDKGGGNNQPLDLRSRIAKTSFFYTIADNLAVATFNPQTGYESLFIYDMAKKAESGFKINFGANTYVKELTLSHDDRMLFYIAGDKFYTLALKK